MSFTLPMLEAGVTAVVGAIRFSLGDVCRTKHPMVDIDLAIAAPLRYAIQFYLNGEQLACIRQLIIALMQVSRLLGWKEAAAYLSEQNVYLSQRLQGNTR